MRNIEYNLINALNTWTNGDLSDELILTANVALHEQLNPELLVAYNIILVKNTQNTVFNRVDRIHEDGHLSLVIKFTNDALAKFGTEE